MRQYSAPHLLKPHAGRWLISLMLALLPLTVKADLFVESFGFNGGEWQFSYVSEVGKFNTAPIAEGYVFVSFVNQRTFAKVNYFLINDGDYYTVCAPKLDSVMTNLRSMAKASERGDQELVVLYESLVHKDLLLTCGKSYRTEMEFKKRFNTAVAYSSMQAIQFK